MAAGSAEPRGIEQQPNSSPPVQRRSPSSSGSGTSAHSRTPLLPREDPGLAAGPEVVRLLLTRHSISAAGTSRDVVGELL
ncbi:unnamed protein product [Tilletia caries]|uniref:Uncharacterized protein n=3 Tax=Tilletia TaxID=13289 RepID=A0A177VAS9_9BASI|nr:hypothetical protein CF336_g9582 [Tilletia laevis]KAE8239939.1 hypothetical protein A4X03_0g8639 [Tilletia caries]KAE8180252.1 hypothetical protein CF335_g9311 [Tilletia laevis]CAD6936388.1 unnamed protein product [Tilletia caries]CAD6955712.1 unnamed protein product [Tilletia caries]